MVALWTSHRRYPTVRMAWLQRQWSMTSGRRIRIALIDCTRWGRLTPLHHPIGTSMDFWPAIVSLVWQLPRINSDRRWAHMPGNSTCALGATHRSSLQRTLWSTAAPSRSWLQPARRAESYSKATKSRSVSASSSSNENGCQIFALNRWKSREVCWSAIAKYASENLDSIIFKASNATVAKPSGLDTKSLKTRSSWLEHNLTSIWALQVTLWPTCIARTLSSVNTAWATYPATWPPSPTPQLTPPAKITWHRSPGIQSVSKAMRCAKRTLSWKTVVVLGVISARCTSVTRVITSNSSTIVSSKGRRVVGFKVVATVYWSRIRTIRRTLGRRNFWLTPWLIVFPPVGDTMACCKRRRERRASSLRRL